MFRTLPIAIAALAALSAPSLAQSDDLYALAPEHVRPDESAAVPWLQRLERDLEGLRGEARAAHWRALADALFVAGDPSGAVTAALAASPTELAEWVHAHVDRSLAAHDAGAVVALCHVLERVAPDRDEVRPELVRATCLVGREWAAQLDVAGTASEARRAAWRLEGIARLAPLDRALDAARELVASGAEDRGAARIAARRALDAGRVETALELLHLVGGLEDDDRARVAAEMWRMGRRQEALALVDTEAHGAAAALGLARLVELPSESLAVLADALPRRDLDGRSALVRARAEALAREGRGEEALARALETGSLDAVARFDLAVRLETGGDRGRATKIAGSDPWSDSLFAVWRASRSRGDVAAEVDRARRAADRAEDGAAKRIELAVVAGRCGLGDRAGSLVAEAVGPNPVAIERGDLERLVRVDLEATGGASLAKLHDGIATPAGRTILAAAVVRTLLDEPRL
ncbi:MAG: hypothetical protein R3F34_19600 [Planctomycetota bacterium]